MSRYFPSRICASVRATILLCFLGLAGVAAVAAAQTPPQESTDNTLHVLRPIIHAEQDNAEFCLEFDHELGNGSYGKIAANIRLDSDGKNHPLTARNISIANDLLCIAPLEHRRSYRFVLAALKTTAGEKLPESYSLSFTIPDRSPSIAFITDGGDRDLTRWQDNDPTLRVLNAPKVELELYRITDPAFMVEAWQQRRQTTLAPTESAYFARHNGQLVWRGEIASPDKPNKILQQSLPLRAQAGDQPPGLYLIVASLPESGLPKDIDRPDQRNSEKPGEKPDDESKPKTQALVSMTAEWLLRSDLQLRAYRSANLLYGATEKADGAALIAGVKLSLYDADSKIIAAADSDNHGVGLLSLGDKKPQHLILMGRAGNGDVAFADIDGDDHRYAAPPPPARIALDRDFYVPDQPIAASASGFDSQGKVLPASDTLMQLLRPDRSLFADLPFAGETASLNFNAPAQNGIWSLAWRKNDGTALAQTPLRITTNPAAPYFTITADRTALGDKDDVTLTIKSLSFGGAAQPYLTGRLTGTWVVPQQPFPDYKDYHFGSGGAANPQDALAAAFMTDEQGLAVLHENLSVPAEAAALKALALTIEGGAASGAAGAAPFQLLVKSQTPLIGIKPLRQDARFAENSVARFALIALDSDGKRRDAQNLSYQIFEDGRSFDWYQSDGRWAYKPLPQQRSLGGGQLDIAADHDAIIEWPVTSGTYHIDIVDDDGNVVARSAFSAGWSASESADAAIGKIDVTANPAILQAGQPTRLDFKLDKASAVTVIVADDHIRQVIHQDLPAGAASLAFTPQADWGRNLGIWIDASALKQQGRLILTSGRKEDMELHDQKPAQPPPVATTDHEPVTVKALIPDDMRTGDRVNMTLTLRNNLAKTKDNVAGLHYSFTALPGSALLAAGKATGLLPPEQSRDVALTLEAVHENAGGLKLDITGPHNLHVSRIWPIANVARDVMLETIAAPTLNPQQAWMTPSPAKAAAQGQASTVFVGSRPLYAMPEMLTTFLGANPFTTRELAQSLDVLGRWHSVIVAANIMPENIWRERRHDLLLRLLQRQKNDGSFADFPQREGSIASTAAAVMALAHSDDPLVKPAMAAAIGWLNGILGNSWFDEKERPLRAAIYAALAEADRLDIASLYYFADTSLDKPMPPLAAAQLAAAFARVKDRAKITVWVNKAQPELEKPDFDAAVLDALVNNPMLDPQSYQASLQRLAQRLGKQTVPDFMTEAAFLTILGAVENHAGAWRIAVDNAPQDGQGIGVFHGIKGVIRNLDARQSVFLAVTREADARPAAAVPVSRHVYRISGNLLSDRQAFDRDAVYAIVIEGEGPQAGAAPLFIRDDVNPLMVPMTCALEPDLKTSDALEWLRHIPPTAPEACEISPHAIDVALPAHTDTASWRIVYLARAKASGFFRFSPPVMR